MPGNDHDDVLAEAAICCSTCDAGAGADADHGDHGADADDDAEHGEERAHACCGVGRAGRRGAMASEAFHAKVRRPGASAGRAARPRRAERLGDGHVAHDAAVAHDDVRLAEAGDVELMGDHDDGHAVVVELLEHAHDLDAGARIQVAGGLVGEEERRLVDEGAGDGDALLLAAGELVGQVVGAVGKADLRRGSAWRARASRRRAARRCA